MPKISTDNINLFKKYVELGLPRIQVELSDNWLYFIDKLSDDKITTSEMSFGEKHYLLLMLIGLASNEKPQIVFLDAPENGISLENHKHILGNILSLNPNTQLIVSTHSPFIYENYIKETINIETLKELKISKQHNISLETLSDIDKTIKNDDQGICGNTFDVSKFTDLLVEKE